MAIRFLIPMLLLVLWLAAPAHAGTQALPFGQDWADTGLIATSGDWSGVPGIVGYRGDDMTAEAGADPQAVVMDGAATPASVLANQANPDAVLPGGLAEFELADPVVALQGSGTADAPHVVIAVDTRGHGAITVSYLLRDLEAGTADAVQPVALQYRIGTSGDFVNVPVGFVADATTGPGAATLVTPVGATLPADADHRPLVQLRIVTANASGADEWVGIDDIRVSGTPLPPPSTTTPPPSTTPLAPAADESPPSLAVTLALRKKLLRTLRLGLSARATLDEPASVRSEIRLSARLARRLRLPRVVGRATTSAAAGTTKIVTKFSAGAKRKLERLRSVRVTLRLRAADPAGNSRTLDRRTTLAR